MELKNIHILKNAKSNPTHLSYIIKHFLLCFQNGDIKENKFHKIFKFNTVKHINLP